MCAYVCVNPCVCWSRRVCVHTMSTTGRTWAGHRGQWAAEPQRVCQVDAQLGGREDAGRWEHRVRGEPLTKKHSASSSTPHSDNNTWLPPLLFVLRFIKLIKGPTAGTLVGQDKFGECLLNIVLAPCVFLLCALHVTTPCWNGFSPLPSPIPSLSSFPCLPFLSSFRQQVLWEQQLAIWYVTTQHCQWEGRGICAYSMKEVLETLWFIACVPLSVKRCWNFLAVVWEGKSTA